MFGQRCFTASHPFSFFNLIKNREIQNANTSDKKKKGRAHKCNTTENRENSIGVSEGPTVYSQPQLVGLGSNDWVCSCEEKPSLKAIKHWKIFSVIMPECRGIIIL